MLCFVSQPNSVVLEVEVDTRADGQDCLDKVSEQLHIIEQDYFGLQYRGSKGETLWLNLRNRIDDQIGGAPPYRFMFRVKFFVEPHYLLQDETKHQFYLQVKQELQSKKYEITDTPQAVKMLALLCQAEHGDATTNSFQQNVYTQMMQGLCEPTEEVLNLVYEEHCELRGMTAGNAEYHLLQEVSELPTYGTEFHDAKRTSGEPTKIGVGPEGLSMYNVEANKMDRIAYALIQMATHMDQKVILRVFDDKGDPSIHLVFRFKTCKAANALYRCVTEMHSFYRCDTVREDVSTQFCRDLKGTICSIFNENTSLGKKYIFDIRRTCREAYDHARRKLWSASHDGERMNGVEPLRRSRESIVCDNNENTIVTSECQELRARLASIEDSLRCVVCMDRQISTTFCPCGHVICCSECTQHITECPVCRTSIDKVQRIFIPGLHLEPPCSHL
ncbi:E3 ubiquitin-protein ligase MYLIP-like [Haliotis rufescens]|uniref:E3 ubiquitin-protein ligase MYLIP-like n=1 Tax=Haliotis rufescens TaxID=6454 RepID=UPI001EAFA1EF|nr:E3 ubiquitin-protein ligase MYLIP-like [Haliotis rufescens]